ncbi:MAG TPA: hypothetical protein PKD53_15680 [Chloroflexaceae bacterium]|nr:hypothetical protein [Chloroflexaceae bacterium]
MASQLSRLMAAALALFVVLAGGSAPSAPAAAAGRPLLVSPSDGGDHYAPDVAALPDGGAVVVWQAAGGPLVGSEIMARRLDPDGAPRGLPFLVNRRTAGQQRQPAVAVRAGGGFVVVWATGNRTVWARRFDADGAPLDQDDLPVSGDGADGVSHYDPDVAALPGGGFVVAWETSSLDGGGILLRRFGPSGAPAGAAQAPYQGGAPAFRANPAIAAAADGAVALAWEEAAPTFDSFAILISRYSAAGAPTAVARPVAASDDELRDPALALDAAGVASVAWTALPGGSPAASWVQLRRLDPSGAPLGPPASIAAADPAERGRLSGPALATGPWGAVAAWPDRTTLQDGTLVGLAARSLSPAGAPTGGERYPRLPAPAGEVAVVAAAATEEGAWLVWSEDVITEGADNLSAVYARRLDPEANVVPPPEGPRPSVYLPLVGRQ